ncbi:MAG: glycine cleavage system protein GcvH [Eubacteriales bacterium]|nr:glycine cleavage system protein GcvH [Eubacteriales bacterium]
MKIENELLYSSDHEWIRVEGTTAYVGITDYAQHSLGDIVYVELPDMDAELKPGETLGVVESVKAASDVYCPVTGVVIDVNNELEDEPEKINSDPYGSWFAALQLSDASELEKLLDAEAYKELCEGEK